MVRHMSTGSELGFGPWLRAELKAKRLTQRQLAERSGVEHSTISRLVGGQCTPSLRTALQLARGLLELSTVNGDAANVHFFAPVLTAQPHPIARTEYALRADPALTDAQVRQVMGHYLAVRDGHLGLRRPATPASHVLPAALSGMVGEKGSSRPSSAQ